MKGLEITQECGGIGTEQAENLVSRMLDQFPEAQKVLIIPPDGEEIFYVGAPAAGLWKMS